MKKIITAILLLTLMCTLLSFNALAAMPDDEIVMPLYNNTATTNTTFTISSGGSAMVKVFYRGYSGVTTGGTITTKIQKYVSGSWQDVDIGMPNNEWVDVSTSVFFTKTHTVQLQSTGIYRAVVEYVISGSGGSDDVINETVEYTY